ncbi:MAG TPA: asparagine--tRNA ligase [Candidatus Norongarragalinales archaeon]|nr:asparagine--tRNA ligase [Candidatus Norongarragalinales archaeon]
MKENLTKVSEALDGKDKASVTLRGWIHRKRVQGNIIFFSLRDSTGVIQLAVKKDGVSEKEFKDAEKALIESTITVKGEVKKDERAPGGFEVQVKSFSVIHFSEIFPIGKDQSTEFLLDVRHLWLRSLHLTNIMKARAEIVKDLRLFFDERTFIEVAPPIITTSACEGGSTLFEFDYFGQKAYLTQSGQLYNEAFITALEKIFILAPSFRAEKSRTVKHLTEYWHLEEEAAFFDNEDNMRLQEEMIEFVAQRLAKNPVVKHFQRTQEELKEVKAPFHRLSYDKAVEKLQSLGNTIEWGDDFGVEHEQLLTNDLKKPLFVHDWPKKIKPFYMEPASDGEHVKNADVLAPQGHGEIIGGSERIWEYDKLVQRMKEQDLNLKDYAWYLDLRKYGSVPHSGFGLGIERLVKWLLNLEHIRDAVPFPRVINRAYP